MIFMQALELARFKLQWVSWLKLNWPKTKRSAIFDRSNAEFL